MLTCPQSAATKGREGDSGVEALTLPLKSGPSVAGCSPQLFPGPPLVGYYTTLWDPSCQEGPGLCCTPCGSRSIEELADGGALLPAPFSVIQPAGPFRLHAGDVAAKTLWEENSSPSPHVPLEEQGPDVSCSPTALLTPDQRRTSSACKTFIVDSWGRRLLLLLGFGICCTACVVLTIALVYQATVTWMPYLSIACIIVYVIGHAIGPSAIPYVITTEMFRQASRPAAFMVAGSVHWLCNFIVGLVFEYMRKGLGAYCFIIFGAVCLATFLFIFFVVPETKGKTFLEISQIMAKKNGLEEITDTKVFLDFNPSAEDTMPEKLDNAVFTAM